MFEIIKRVSIVEETSTSSNSQDHISILLFKKLQVIQTFQGYGVMNVIILQLLIYSSPAI